MKKMGRDYCTGNPYEYDDGQPEPVPVPAEPAHVACSCPMCCPAKHEINAALANAAEYTCPRCGSKISTHICMSVAGEAKTLVPEFCPHGVGIMSGMACGNCEAEQYEDDCAAGFDGPGDFPEKGIFAKRPAPTVAAPAEGKQVRELLCQKCDRDYPVWFAPNTLWSKVAEGLFSFLCMDCFALLAESKGVVPTAWMIIEEDINISDALEKLRRLERASTPPTADLEGKRVTAEEFWKTWVPTEECEWMHTSHKRLMFKFAEAYARYINGRS